MFRPSPQKENQIAERLHYSIRRGYVDAFFMRRVAELAPDSLVLDLGGHKASKRGKFNIAHYPLRVLYANWSLAHAADVQADAAYLPFMDASFDSVICGELLEHVADPLRVLREVHRSLKSGGVLLITVPFMFPMHEQPYDFGRYTTFYWQKYLAEIGYRHIEIEPQGYYWSVLVDLIRQQFYFRASMGRPRPVWLRDLLSKMMRRAVEWAICRDTHPDYPTHTFHSKYTTGFGIRCTKDA